MKEYLQQHGAFTIKDVVRVTKCNNPYRVIEHMKRVLGKPLRHIDVAKKKTWFRVYFMEYLRAYQWSPDNLPKNAKLAPRRAR
jgi:hypothetical protein